MDDQEKTKEKVIGRRKRKEGGQELETAAQADWDLRGQLDVVSVEEMVHSIMGSVMVLGSQSQWEEYGIYWRDLTSDQGKIQGPFSRRTGNSTASFCRDNGEGEESQDGENWGIAESGTEIDWETLAHKYSERSSWG